MDVILPTTLDATSLDALQAQLEVRADVLVLRGQGDVFCHGLSLRALRRTSTQAATVLKRATAPIGAVSLGAERTRVRLQHPEVKERIARFLDGGTPWS
jgi:enoyl-CoA hydratase/carnithine racemase